MPSKGVLCLFFEGAVASEDLQMLPDVFVLDFWEPFLVGCLSQHLIISFPCASI